ncbi:glycerol-3-phosphate acyltransferase [Chloroflexota bacterium]
MIIALWFMCGFLSGSLPFSYWIGRIAVHDDIRHYGDGNPGAINALKAGGWKAGILAILLDYLKGAIPVGLANFVFDMQGPGLVLVALSPILGHAFSPFLGFRGGKAVAVTFGVWTGLLLWEGPTIFGIWLGIFVLVQVVDSWAVVLSMIMLLVYLALRRFESDFFFIAVGNLILLTWKHLPDLRQPPRFRPWLLKITGRRP